MDNFNVSKKRKIDYFKLALINITTHAYRGLMYKYLMTINNNNNNNNNSVGVGTT